MPLPMVHLLVAKELNKNMGFKYGEYFYLGNIAPDSIHVRNGSTRADKHKTHLYSFSDNLDDTYMLSKNNLCDLIFRSCNTNNKDLQHFSVGYAVHALVDMNWIRRIFTVFDRCLRCSGLNYYNVRSVYYDETKACDLSLFTNDNQLKNLLLSLKDVSEFDFYNILTKEEIRSWKQSVIDKMEKPKNNYIVKPYYITVDVIKEFVAHLVPEIIGFLKDLELSLI